MEVTIYFEKDRTTQKINFIGKTVADLLKHLELNPEKVLVVRNEEVLTEDEVLNDQDKVEFLSVISGG